MLPYAIIATGRIFLRGMRGGRARRAEGYKDPGGIFICLFGTRLFRRVLVLLPYNYLAEKILSEKRGFFYFDPLFVLFILMHLYLYKVVHYR